MTPLWLNRIAALTFALALALPPPEAKAQVLTLGTCAGGSVTIEVPGSDGSGGGHGDDHGCCKRACHAGTERRKRGGVTLNDCC